MTMFEAARETTKYLVTPFDKGDSASWANLLNSCPAILPAITDTARWASGVATACLFSAIGAILRILRGVGYGAPMNSLMARDTYSHAVVDVKRQFWIGSKRLNVMGVNIVTAFAALLASMAVTNKNGCTPFRQSSFKYSALRGGRYPAFPDRRSFTRSPLVDTFEGAKRDAGVGIIERLSARPARPNIGLTTMRPTLFRAILCRIGAVLLYNKWLTASSTFKSNASVFHGIDYTTQHKNMPGYVAVALERYLAAFNIEAELIT